MKKFATIAQIITFFAAAFGTIEFVNERLVIAAIGFWLTYTLVCLGLVTAQEAKDFRSK